MADAASRPITHETGTTRVKRGLAEMLKGGVIMDVVDPEQAKVAEDAGAVAVMALERVPSDIRRDGGVARMSQILTIYRNYDYKTQVLVASVRHPQHVVEAALAGGHICKIGRAHV